MSDDESKDGKEKDMSEYNKHMENKRSGLYKEKPKFSLKPKSPKNLQPLLNIILILALCTAVAFMIYSGSNKSNKTPDNPVITKEPFIPPPSPPQGGFIKDPIVEVECPAQECPECPKQKTCPKRKPCPKQRACPKSQTKELNFLRAENKKLRKKILNFQTDNSDKAILMSEKSMLTNENRELKKRVRRLVSRLQDVSRNSQKCDYFKVWADKFFSSGSHKTRPWRFYFYHPNKEPSCGFIDPSTSKYVRVHCTSPDLKEYRQKAIELDLMKN